MHRAIVPTTAVADPAGVNTAGPGFTTSAVTAAAPSGGMAVARIADTTAAMADRGAATAARVEARVEAKVEAKVEANTAANIAAVSGTTGGTKSAAMDAVTSAKPD